MHRTNIEWVRNPDRTKGFVWNFTTGCPRHCVFADGGKCYAWNLANGRLKRIYLANPNVAPGCDPADPFSPRFWPERLDGPRRRKKPAMIFVDSMGDEFAPCVPRPWQDAGFEVERECPQHIFAHLTKFPRNLAGHNPWPDNAWVGVSAINNEMAIRAIRWLAGVNAPVKFLSCEPLLGSVYIMYGMNVLDWVIIGAQTNPNVQPKKEWVQDILDVTSRFKIPVFMKDNLEWPFHRQEWPKVERIPNWRASYRGLTRAERMRYEI